MVVNYTANDATLDTVDRIKLKIINNTTNESKEFFIEGVNFNTDNQQRTTDVNGNNLNIIDLVNKTTDRHNASNSFQYQLIGQIYANNTYSDIAKAGGSQSPTVTSNFNLTPIDMIFSNVTASLKSNKIDSVILNVKVTKQNSAHISNRTDITVSEHTTLSGTVNPSYHNQIIYTDGTHNFGKIASNAAGREHTFEYDITNLTDLDLFDASEIKVSARPVYNVPEGNAFYMHPAFDDYITSVDGWKPFFKINEATSDFTLYQRDVDVFSVDVNVRGKALKALTNNPGGFNFIFTDPATNNTITEFRSIDDAYVDTNAVVSFNIESLFSQDKGGERNLECEIVPRFSGVGGHTVNGTSVIKTLKIDPTPKIEFIASNRRGMMLDGAGKEYFCARFKPIQDNSLVGFFPDNLDWKLDVVIKENKNNSTVVTRTYDLTGDQIERAGEGEQDEKFIAFTIPTGVNVYTGVTTDLKYYLSLIHI